MTTATGLDRIGVGIDTARYGHRASSLRPDLKPAARPLTVTEDRAGYTALRGRLEHLRQNFPERTTDDTESQAMARFALVERPEATPAPAPPMASLRELVGRLQGQVKQTTRATNRLHDLTARTSPELAHLTEDIAAGWVLHLLRKYPTAERIAAAHLASLQEIPYLDSEKARAIHQAAGDSVASLRGPAAAALVGDLVAQVVSSRAAERELLELVKAAWDDLPASPHARVLTIPGIGPATAAIPVAEIVDIERFATPASLVNYFGIFPEEGSPGTDKEGRPRPTAVPRMSRKGNDLARAYLWDAARSAIVHNPAVRALHRRSRAEGRRGDVAIGHCMRKLLHLVDAVWKADRPFDPGHCAWEPGAAEPRAGAGNEGAVGHERDEPAGRVVTTAILTVEPTAAAVDPAAEASRVARPRVDYAFLRQQISMEQVLAHLGLPERLRGGGPRRRGPCPLHGHPAAAERTFSANLSKNIFKCFHAECGARGNALDLRAAVHRLPLYDAALHLADTFGLRRDREEGPVPGTRHPR